ncbi:MAG: peptide synthase [Candidatus Angelobacter sp. Gp1-AA117]|nr:MAG: peptide synthase [Candidatus Angelobacter sp. Gp1-AA117]
MRPHILEDIRSHALAKPNQLAVCDSQLSINYGDLDRFSTSLALHLQAIGCKTGSRVVMVANRRAVMVAAILGTFKAGCIHVPLDPRMPAARLQYILNDIAPAAVITEEDLRETIEAYLPPQASLLLQEDLERILQASAATDYAPGPDVSSPGWLLDLPAYCIYTSGSTGRPKGVLIDHRNIVDFYEGAAEVYDVRAESVCASFSPLHFDVFLMDMLFPLAQGARLHVHDDIVFSDLLFQTIATNNVTHFSAWGLMLGLIAQALEFGTTPLPHLQTVLTGTDIPNVDTVQRWLRAGTGVKVINAYGPTEVTCGCTAYTIRDHEPGRKELYPIGRPFKHVQTFLVGSEGERITQSDVPGELYIGGTQVMRGYWNLAAETEAAVTYLDGIRCYRSGDVCIYQDDGNLFYLGRKDNEVKIGGYRVHPNEVRRAINSVPNVHDSEVVLVQTKYREKVLAAGILLNESGKAGTLDADQQILRIRARLMDELPAYMVPRYLAIFDDFPKLSSGKADRKALTSILTVRMTKEAEEVVATHEN